jgi:hypothetical protein
MISASLPSGKSEMISTLQNEFDVSFRVEIVEKGCFMKTRLEWDPKTVKNIDFNSLIRMILLKPCSQWKNFLVWSMSSESKIVHEDLNPDPTLGQKTEKKVVGTGTGTVLYILSCGCECSLWKFPSVFWKESALVQCVVMQCGMRIQALQVNCITKVETFLLSSENLDLHS